VSNRLHFLHLRHQTDGEGLAARDRWQWAVLGVVLIGATMSALDISIVNIALPTIRREFGVRLSLLEWVSMSYIIVLAIALPIVGRLADIYGRSRLYNIGFAVFVVGSAICGLAPTAEILIVARALQAVGAGLLQANSVALITQVFRSRELGHALGIQAAIQATAMALGPFVGAMLIATVGWRLIFYVNVPIGIAGFFLAHFILPRYHLSNRRQKIDYRGIFSFTLALLGLALAVNYAQTRGWTSPLVLSLLVMGATCLVLFVMVEHKVKAPMIDLTLFHRYTLVAGNMTAFLAYYALFTILFLLPFYFEEVPITRQRYPACC
jgi:EmrB/QacA subfamily drug resistance transporter